MSHIRRFDHVGITVADLETVTDFFVALSYHAQLSLESSAASVSSQAPSL